MKALLLEDDKKISDFIREGLQQEGYSVNALFNGDEGLAAATTLDHDLIILDLMMPGVDGLTILNTLKKQGNTTPVLILSAKHSVEDRVLGLDMGADDYLVKPFSFAELIARINAILRRKQEPKIEDTWVFEELKLDRYSRQLLCDGQNVDLKPKEFSLLELFIKNKERVLSKTYILDQIWNIDFDPQTNVVDVLVCRLRNKLEKATNKKYIVTMRGIGYVLKKQ